MDQSYNRGVRAGSAGKEEMRQSYEECILAKDDKIKTQESIIGKQEQYIHEQDDFIDSLA